MGNSRGGYSSTRERTMAAYDKLHPAVRQALQTAMFDWATQPIRTQLERDASPKIMVRKIQEWDKNHAAKTRKRYWGNEYPSFKRGI